MITRRNDDVLKPQSIAEFLRKKIKGSTVRIIQVTGRPSVVEKPKEPSEAIIQFLQEHEI